MRQYIFSVLFFLTHIVLSQNFEVNVSQKKIGLHETFEISFTLNGSGKSFSPPPFSNFQIVRGPNKSSSTSIINGSLTQELTYTYVLKPKKIGVFTILPATIKYKGNVIGTKPTTIQVQKGSTPKKSNSPYDIVSRKIHLNVTSNKSVCYVGEPVVLTYVLYFNLNIGSLSPNSIKYTNFWANEIDANNDTKKQTFKGESYNAAIIKQVVLTPQLSGIQTVEPLSINLVASVPTGRRDFFNMITSQNIDYTVVANNLSITVLDLPKEGRPDNFSGAIGDFDLSVNLDRDSIDINESVTFTVKIKGKGNLNLINSPKVNFDKQLEVFEPKNADKIKINQTGIQGYKKEEYLIVPRHKGVYNLQPVKFNFFNPKTKRYVSVLSQDMKIKVGGDQQATDSYTLQTINKEQVDLLNEDIKFIKTTYSGVSVKSNFNNSIFFYLLIFIAILIVILVFLNQNKFIDFNILFDKTILNESVEKLQETQSLLKQKKYQEFQSSILNVLFLYVSKKFSINKANLSVGTIENELIKNEVPENLISDYLDLIKYLERCKYSSYDGDKINKDLYARALDLINKIDVKK
ncbi:MAG: hypothetical protein CMP50_05275 [Flavobacteriales bacterium]|nr:hypothetical protein [Flavobacteriales bacterium]